MRLSTLFLFGLFIGWATAQTPISPQKPILLETEIGEVAESGGKAKVLVVATVTPKQIICTVQIKAERVMGSLF